MDLAALDFATWVKSGDTVTWGQANAEPLTLTRTLVAQRERLPRLRVFLGIGASETLQPEHADTFDFVGYTGSGHRALVEAGLLDILPVHYSQLPALLGPGGALRIDVLLLQVSAADEQGRHSLGMANEYLIAALAAARVVIAEVNEDVPFTFGERSLSAEDFDLLVPAQTGPLNAPAARMGEVEQAIGRRVASLIDDGATLQLGIGNIPEAVLGALTSHRHLGIHSGALCDGVAELAEAGILTNALKNIDPGLTVAGVLMGGERLRRWAHGNRKLSLRSTTYTHSASLLASIHRLVAINSAIEVDLTGQVNAETAGGVYMGAVGGALDFLRGAAQSRGGLPLIALPSTARGRSRIVERLSGPVSTPRSDVGVIVTEHGIADLRGLTLAQRVERMIGIAAPAHRESLARQASARLSASRDARSV